MRLRSAALLTLSSFALFAQNARATCPATITYSIGGTTLTATATGGSDCNGAITVLAQLDDDEWDVELGHVTERQRHEVAQWTGPGRAR